MQPPFYSFVFNNSSASASYPSFDTGHDDLGTVVAK